MVPKGSIVCTLGLLLIAAHTAEAAARMRGEAAEHPPHGKHSKAHHKHRHAQGHARRRMHAQQQPHKMLAGSTTGSLRQPQQQPQADFHQQPANTNTLQWLPEDAYIVQSTPTTQYALFNTVATFSDALDTCHRNGMRMAGEDWHDFSAVADLCSADDRAKPGGCWLSADSPCSFVIGGVLLPGACESRKGIVCVRRTPATLASAQATAQLPTTTTTSTFPLTAQDKGPDPTDPTPTTSTSNTWRPWATSSDPQSTPRLNSYYDYDINAYELYPRHEYDYDSYLDHFNPSSTTSQTQIPSTTSQTNPTTTSQTNPTTIPTDFLPVRHPATDVPRNPHPFDKDYLVDPDVYDAYVDYLSYEEHAGSNTRGGFNELFTISAWQASQAVPLANLAEAGAKAAAAAGLKPWTNEIEPTTTTTAAATTAAAATTGTSDMSDPLGPFPRDAARAAATIPTTTTVNPTTNPSTTIPATIPATTIPTTSASTTASSTTASKPWLPFNTWSSPLYDYDSYYYPLTSDYPEDYYDAGYGYYDYPLVNNLFSRESKLAEPTSTTTTGRSTTSRFGPLPVEQVAAAQPAATATTNPAGVFGAANPLASSWQLVRDPYPDYDYDYDYGMYGYDGYGYAYNDLVYGSPYFDEPYLATPSTWQRVTPASDPTKCLVTKWYPALSSALGATTTTSTTTTQTTTTSPATPTTTSGWSVWSTLPTKPTTTFPTTNLPTSTTPTTTAAAAAAAAAASAAANAKSTYGFWGSVRRPDYYADYDYDYGYQYDSMPYSGEQWASHSYDYVGYDNGDGYGYYDSEFGYYDDGAPPLFVHQLQQQQQAQQATPSGAASAAGGTVAAAAAAATAVAPSVPAAAVVGGASGLSDYKTWYENKFYPAMAAVLGLTPIKPSTSSAPVLLPTATPAAASAATATPASTAGWFSGWQQVTSSSSGAASAAQSQQPDARAVQAAAVASSAQSWSVLDAAVEPKADATLTRWAQAATQALSSAAKPVQATSSTTTASTAAALPGAAATAAGSVAGSSDRSLPGTGRDQYWDDYDYAGMLARAWAMNTQQDNAGNADARGSSWGHDEGVAMLRAAAAAAAATSQPQHEQVLQLGQPTAGAAASSSGQAVSRKLLRSAAAGGKRQHKRARVAKRQGLRV